MLTGIQPRLRAERLRRQPRALREDDTSLRKKPYEKKDDFPPNGLYNNGKNRYKVAASANGPYGGKSVEREQTIGELFQAVQAGDAEKLKSLLETSPDLANAENGQGLTLLGYAAHFGNGEAVRVLLEHGANVNAVSRSKVAYIPSNTALHAAIAGKRSIEVVRLLLNHGADTGIMDSNGHTCLHTAAFHDDNVELIRLLLEHGADVNAAAGNGETAFAIAKGQGNGKVAELLQEAGRASGRS